MTSTFELLVKLHLAKHKKMMERVHYRCFFFCFFIHLWCEHILNRKLKAEVMRVSRDFFISSGWWVSLFHLYERSSPLIKKREKMKNNVLESQYIRKNLKNHEHLPNSMILSSFKWFFLFEFCERKSLN